MRDAAICRTKQNIEEAPGESRGPLPVSGLFSCQKNACQCRRQGEGSKADKAPFKGVDDHPHNSSFRDAVIPTGGIKQTDTGSLERTLCPF